MYQEEHGLPHFHACYAEHDASIAIDTLEILGGEQQPHQVLGVFAVGLAFSVAPRGILPGAATRRSTPACSASKPVPGRPGLMGRPH